MFKRLILAALLASCAETPLTFRFDADTTAEERRMTILGMEDWYPEVLPDDRPVYHPAGAWRITFTEDILYRGMPMDGRACASTKAWCPHALQIRIRRGLTPERTRLVATHEVGHAMGLGHVDDPNAVMSGKPLGPRHINEADRTECRRAGRCGSVRVTISKPKECEP